MASENVPDSPRQIKSVQKAAELLDIIQTTNQPTFSELCERVDSSKGTVHTYLKTLETEGLVTESAGVYRLGFNLVTMGEAVRNGAAIYQAGREVVDNLAEQTGEWVHLTVEHQGREITLYETSGGNPVAKQYHDRTREEPQFLHQTATGKAILASFDDEDIEQIIEQHGLEGRTKNTITSPDPLFQEIERIRTRGYAINDEEEVRGMRSVGAAVQTDDSTVAGAISITGPTSRLSDESLTDRIPDLIVEAANVIQVNIETAEITVR